MKAWVAFVVVLVGTCSSVVNASESREHERDAGVSSELKAVSKEIRELRVKIDELEKRMGVIEREAAKNLLGGPSPMKLQGIRAVLPERPERELGLYVFPGLDAPPLSPKSYRPD